MSGANKRTSLFSSKSDAGKGDKPRNIGKKYWNNFDQIDWGRKKEHKKTK